MAATAKVKYGQIFLELSSILNFNQLSITSLPQTYDYLSAKWLIYTVISHNRRITTVFQNNKTATMLVFQTNPLGVESFTYVKSNTFFCSN